MNLKTKQKKELTNVWGKYTFSDKEKVGIAKTLASKNLEKDRLESEKKSVMSSFKAKTDGVLAEINELSGHYSTGYKYQYYKCFVEINRKDKTKAYKDVETGKVIEERKLTQEDKQYKLNM